MQPRAIAWTLVAATVLGLAASFALKETCNLNPWEDELQYRAYCYSDIFPLYERFHLNEDDPAFPYLLSKEQLRDGSRDGYTPIEYPVLTVTFAWAAALATPDKVSYMHVTFAALLACGAAVTWALHRSGVDWKRVALWAAGPPIIVHGLTNWDLLAVALAAGGWLAWLRGKPVLAATLFGLGGAAKLYPAFFLPFLAWETLWARGDAEAPKAANRWGWRPDWNRTAAVALGGVLGFVLPNLIVWRMAPAAWWDVWRFHGQRDPDWETPFEVLREVLDGPKDEAWRALIGTGGLVVVAAIGIALAWAMWRRGLGALVAGGLASLAFLLFNRVYSPQYTLWVLPLLLLMRAPWRPVLLFVAADLAVFLLRYPLLQGYEDPDWMKAAHRAAVLVRWVALAACMWRIAQQEGLLPERWRRRKAPDPAAGPAQGP